MKKVLLLVGTTLLSCVLLMMMMISCECIVHAETHSEIRIQQLLETLPVEKKTHLLNAVVNSLVKDARIINHVPRQVHEGIRRRSEGRREDEQLFHVKQWKQWFAPIHKTRRRNNSFCHVCKDMPDVVPILAERFSGRTHF